MNTETITKEIINPSQIKIVHPIHKLPMGRDFKKIKYMAHKGKLHQYEGFLKVYKLNGEYILLSNRFGYEICKLTEQDEVEVQIYPVTSREEYATRYNFKALTVEVSTHSIVIPEELKKTKVGSKKLKEKIKYLRNNGHIDKPISTQVIELEDGSAKLLLVDGYSRYVASKILKVRKIKANILG